VLPEGITADSVYAVIGTPRTKYGFGTAFIELAGFRNFLPFDEILAGYELGAEISQFSGLG